MEIRRPRNRVEHRAALARLIDPNGAADPLIGERVDMLEDYARKRNLSLDPCLILVHGNIIRAVCLCLDAPGRTASILISPSVNEPELREPLASMLRQLQEGAAGRNVQLLQGMVAPECREDAFIYEAAGFNFLATLLYMQNDLRRLRVRPTRRVLTWETYSPRTHELFKRVVEGTYEDSLDCGSLNGVRDIEDILASHRATGRFDPYYWRVGLSDGRPVGVILLSYMEEHQTFEVVYMGCLPACRNNGFGSSLLAHGVELARSRGLTAMSLSVDERNTPARRMYASFGFTEMARRDVWIKVLG
ncbi:MAG TPA: GNAT family N-acetyltransferase [Phycisphaerae bacterium]|nr:GNAT family N-acetyltransferase [Phycisphaerae bacterium]HOJ74856.1 GNAT family N-acetyltransferase [Phycisphaerae bacterium]HOM52019.1 GNAT family N-acetyltransferase [Phycisphaerae bacterium]HON66583.1 GNAT family N-acetyltransferase [Phycisphaerae bacterium]HOQ86220.1 GNAT family N-acetyltransferase [Phycisphaerae bacterium]